MHSCTLYIFREATWSSDPLGCCGEKRLEATSDRVDSRLTLIVEMSAFHRWRQFDIWLRNLAFLHI